ncbi:MAG: hypothetical protein AAF415_18925, partial [Pseudomonadota bacterium]
DTVASSNEVIVLTATDGRTLEFADIDADGNFVAPEGQVTGEQIPVSDPDLFEDDLLTSDPTAAAAELDALGVDIDVVFIDPDDFLLTSLLDLVEGPNGDGAIEPSGPMGLDTLIETPTSGDVDAVEAFTVAINGTAVDGIDASSLVQSGSSFTFEATDLSVFDGDEVSFTFVTDGVDIDGDGDFTTTLSKTVDNTVDQIEFALDLENETATLV